MLEIKSDKEVNDLINKDIERDIEDQHKNVVLQTLELHSAESNGKVKPSKEDGPKVDTTPSNGKKQPEKTKVLPPDIIDKEIDWEKNNVDVKMKKYEEQTAVGEEGQDPSTSTFW